MKAPKRRRKASAKDDMLRVRVTDAQRVAFEEAANRLGIGLSAFARMSMIERARKEGVNVD
jgi:hypothetical protein